MTPDLIYQYLLLIILHNPYGVATAYHTVSQPVYANTLDEAKSLCQTELAKEIERIQKMTGTSRVDMTVGCIPARELSMIIKLPGEQK